MSRLFILCCFVIYFAVCTLATSDYPSITLTDDTCGKLSSLSGTVINGADATDKSLTYTMTLCQTSTDTSCAGSICQYKNKAFQNAIGSFTKSPAPTIKENKKSLSIAFTNGGFCRGVNSYSSNVEATCGNSNHFVVSQTTAGGCAYDIKLQLKEIPGICKADSGLSGGAIFLIVVFSLLAVYFLAGFAICHFKFGQPLGLASIPNQGFWFALPGLFLAGIFYVVGKIKGLFGKSDTITSSEGEYDQV